MQLTKDQKEKGLWECFTFSHPETCSWRWGSGEALLVWSDSSYSHWHFILIPVIRTDSSYSHWFELFTLIRVIHTDSELFASEHSRVIQIGIDTASDCKANVSTSDVEKYFYKYIYVPLLKYPSISLWNVHFEHLMKPIDVFRPLNLLICLPPEMDTTLGNHLPPFLVPQVKFMEQQNETPRNAWNMFSWFRWVCLPLSQCALQWVLKFSGFRFFPPSFGWEILTNL